MDPVDQLRAVVSRVPRGHLPRPGTPALVRELADNPEPGSREWVAARTLETLTQLNDNLRQSYTDKLWQTIPAYVEEWGRLDAWAPATPLVLTPEFAELIRVERVVVSIPTGCSGMLTLGGHVFPNLPAGVSSLALGKLLDGGAARRLDCASGAGGLATLALYGHQLPTTGSMSP